MSKMKFFLSFFLFILLTLGCSKILNMNVNGVSDEEKTELQIINKIAKNLKNDRKINLGSIGSEKKEGYYIRSLGFQMYGKLTIDEMRELIIYLLNLFIENYNASEKLLSYVKTPYDVKNFEIVVFLHDKDNWDMPPDELSTGDFVNNRLTYYKSNRKELSMTKIYEETYEEALQKLAKNK